MALGKFLLSLSLYFPVCVLGLWDQVIHRSPFGLDIPGLRLSTLHLALLCHWVSASAMLPTWDAVPCQHTHPPSCGSLLAACGFSVHEIHLHIFVGCSGRIWNACLFLLLPSEPGDSLGQSCVSTIRQMGPLGQGPSLLPLKRFVFTTHRTWLRSLAWSSLHSVLFASSSILKKLLNQLQTQKSGNSLKNLDFHL